MAFAIAGLLTSTATSLVARERVTIIKTKRAPVKVTPPVPANPPAKPSPIQETKAEPAEPETQLEPLPNVDEGGRLDLMCFGVGAANKVDVIQGYGSGSYSGSYWGSNGTFGSVNGSSWSNSTAYVPRSQDFQDQVSLFIEGADGRIRMPRVMLPVIRGGKDGWFKLKDVVVKPNEITASIAVNILNNPKLRLDRYSGMISISGKAGDYVGPCRRLDPRVQQKQF